MRIRIFGRAARKLREKRALTFIEMLVCVLLLIILAGICSTGLSLAMNSYDRSVFESESQMLENTLNTAISDVLRYAEDIEPVDPDSIDNADGYEVYFTNTSYGVARGSLGLDAFNMLAVIKADGTTGNLLLGSKTYGDALSLSGFTLKYKDGTFTGSYTINSTRSDDLSRLCTFSFRTII